MNLREATPEDAEHLDAFLAQHADTSMFLRGNLESQGVGWTDAPHSTRFFLWSDSEPRAVFGLSKNNYILAQAETAPPEAFTAFAKAIQSLTVQGMTGAVSSVAQTLDALGLSEATYAIHRDEPLYGRFLEGLESTAKLRPPKSSDIPILETWFAQYEIDTGLSDPETAARNGVQRANWAVGPDNTARVMVDESDTPLAMVAINARVGDLVQVGGVFVPPEARNLGFARQATAARLVEERENGARKAILFASGPAASRAYEAIGFQHIGTYRIAILAEPHRIE